MMIITIMTILTKLISNLDVEDGAVMINFVLILFFLTQTQLVMSSSSTTSLPSHGRRRRRRWVTRISRQYKRQATLAPSTPHGVRNVFGLVRPRMPALLTWFVQGAAAVAVVGPPFHAGVAPSYAPFEDAPNHPVGGRCSSGGHVCEHTKSIPHARKHPPSREKMSLALGTMEGIYRKELNGKLYSEKL